MPGIDTTSDIDTLAKLGARVAALERQFKDMPDRNSLSLMVFSGDLDKLMAAFVMATGASACDMKVTMFFSFWGTAALKKDGPQSPGKSLVERMFGWMLPGGWGRRKLSNMHMGGMGRWLMSREMQRKRIPDLATLVQTARDTGVRIVVCETSMNLMGIRMEELIDYPEICQCGVAHFLDTASQSGTTLFIG
ncbi:MAG: DsrE/DsrF/DrsH-like family protein [Gemmataceae bacterium]